MAVHVLLLRAIGPVTHSRMSMAALRERLAEAGFGDVVTVGNTGNAIVRSDGGREAVRVLAQEVVDGFGIRSEVFVRSPRQMLAVVRANPFPKAAAEDPAHTGVCSFHRAPDWAKLAAYDGPAKLAHVGSHLVRVVPAGSPVFDVEKLLGARMTERNWRVFAKLAERAEGHGKRGP